MHVHLPRRLTLSRHVYGWQRLCCLALSAVLLACAVPSSTFAGTQTSAVRPRSTDDTPDEKTRLAADILSLTHAASPSHSAAALAAAPPPALRSADAEEALREFSGMRMLRQATVQVTGSRVLERYPDGAVLAQDAHGTGVLIGEDERSWFVLTVAHTPDAAGDIAMLENHRVIIGGRELTGTLRAVDTRHDLAILAVSKPSTAEKETPQVATLAQRKDVPVTRQPLIAMVYASKGGQPQPRPMSGYWTKHREPAVVLEGGPVHAGQSGSSVANEAGEIIGLIVRGMEVVQEAGAPNRPIGARAVSIDAIHDFLSVHGVPGVPDAPVPAPTWSDTDGTQTTRRDGKQWPKWLLEAVLVFSFVFFITGPSFVGLLPGRSLKEFVLAMSAVWVAWGLLETFYAVRQLKRQMEQPARLLRWVDGDWFAHALMLPVGYLAMFVASLFAVVLKSVVAPWIVTLCVGGALVGVVGWLSFWEHVNRWWKTPLVDSFRRLIWTATHGRATRQRFVESAFRVLAEHPRHTEAAIAILRMEGQTISSDDPSKHAMIRALEASLWAEVRRRLTNWPGHAYKPASNIIDTLEVLGWEPRTSADVELANAFKEASRHRPSLRQVLEARGARAILARLHALKLVGLSTAVGLTGWQMFQAPALALFGIGFDLVFLALAVAALGGIWVWRRHHRAADAGGPGAEASVPPPESPTPAPPADDEALPHEQWPQTFLSSLRLIVPLIGLDQITKWAARSLFPLAMVVEGGWAMLGSPGNKVAMPGAPDVWWLLNGVVGIWHAHHVVPLLVYPLLVIAAWGALTVYHHVLPSFHRLGLRLAAAGAFSQMIDLAWRGGVTDWLVLPFGTTNLADVFLWSAGVIGIVDIVVLLGGALWKTLRHRFVHAANRRDGTLVEDVPPPPPPTDDPVGPAVRAVRRVDGDG